MFATICYYLEEFVQAYGRDYRVSTVSDVYNYAVFFEDTIVANHVAPKLAKKLSSINSFSGTGVNLEEDLVNAVVAGKVKRKLDEEDTKAIATVSEQEDFTEEDEDSEDDDDNDKE